MVKKVDTKNESAWYALASARILIGVIFLWAFFDKLFGLGFATPVAKSWLNGGSPTTGFLKGVVGPFADVFNSIAGQPWADWLFMAGLLGIGVGLICGIAIRLTAVTGSVLLLCMWMASLPLKTNPILDDHIVYIAILIAVGLSLDQQKLSFAKFWQSIPVVKRNPWLQ